MAPPLLFDISDIDLDHVQYDVAQIEQRNPHRGVMRMLDGVNYVSSDLMLSVAYKLVRNDEFWVAGHIPMRPLLPGVLLIESAAQLASFTTLLKYPDVKFIGFVGLDAVKFRGQVEPGHRVTILAKAVEFRPRRSICQVQCIVNGAIVMEGRITGMPI